MTKLCPRGKAAAKRKFKVYPSAYANAYASKICAGKAKDPSGVKKKDWGPKKANKGAMMKKFNNGDEVKVKRIDPLGARLSSVGMKGGASKSLKLSYTQRKKLGRSLAKKFNSTKSKTQQDKIIKTVREKGVREMFNTFKERSGKAVGNTMTTYTKAGKKPTMKQYETPYNKRSDYNKGGKVMKNKPIKAGKGMLMPMFGLAGMMKYMQMNKKKSGTVLADPNAVDPITGKGAGQSQNIQDFGKQAVNKMVAKKGKLARKPKKAGLGMLMLMNHMKKQGKKEGRKQAAQGELEVLAAKNAAEQNSGMSKMNNGGYVSGSYIRDDSSFSETNSSTSDYYKDMLD